MGVAMPELLLTIHLVRHGETVANRKGIIQGQEDSELTPLGIDQAVATATRLRGNKYWQVYTSDLVRAFRTAEIILEEHEGPVPKKSELLREFRLGVQEGLPRGTTRSEACRIKAEKEGVPLTDYVAPRRETVSEVRKRSRTFLKRLIAEAMRDAPGLGKETTRDAPGRGKEATLALVVAHGGLLNVMMVGVMGLGEEVGFMTNCGVTIVDVFEKGDGEGRVLYRARTVNDDKHLVQTGLKTGSQVETFVRRKKEPIVAERRSAGGIET